MSAAVLPVPVDLGLPPRKRVTRAEFHRMIDAGVFVDQRVELVNGDLIDKMAQKPPHNRTVRHLTALFSKTWPGNRVQVQSPIEASGPDFEYSEPEPDLCVLAEDQDDYRDRNPRGHEVLLAVEVSDSTLRYDLTVKRDLYARAGVPEYWVLDLNLRRVTVHRDPAEGVYGEVEVFSPGQTISPEHFAGISFSVEDLIPA